MQAICSFGVLLQLGAVGFAVGPCRAVMSVQPMHAISDERLHHNGCANLHAPVGAATVDAGQKARPRDDWFWASVAAKKLGLVGGNGGGFSLPVGFTAGLDDAGLLVIFGFVTQQPDGLAEDGGGLGGGDVRPFMQRCCFQGRSRGLGDGVVIGVAGAQVDAEDEVGLELRRSPPGRDVGRWL